VVTRGEQLAVFREPSFLFYVGSRLFSGVALSLFRAAVLWHVFELSGSAFQLGLIGLVQFIPALGLSLIGGAVADSHDRRRIAMIAQLAPLACSAVLCVATESGVVSLSIIYALVFLVAVATAFENPARMALLPLLVPREMFPRAVTVNSTVTALALMSGPVVMGFVSAWAGIGAAYAVHAGLMIASIAALSRVRLRRGQSERVPVTWQAIKEGVSFVRGTQVVLGCMTLDMFAVIFGGATALLPIYAKEILQVGELGYGLLAASLEIGAFAMAIVLVLTPTVQRAGRVLVIAVAVFGLATVVFGFSRSFPLSVAAYMVVGMADQLSVVMRGTTIQLSTPDELRGRVSSVNMIFIGASNQLGAVESGFVAALTSATFAVVSGGVGCLIVLAIVAAKMPELRRYRV
jgi:MFS family permease